MRLFSSLVFIILMVIILGSCLILGDTGNTEGDSSNSYTAYYTAAKAVITAKCVSCHGASGGVSFNTDADIVARAARIKDRAVDKGDMPPGNPLTADEKKKINDWVTNGGRLTN
jgi:uncharacterized membrane protein